MLHRLPQDSLGFLLAEVFRVRSDHTVKDRTAPMLSLWRRAHDCGLFPRVGISSQSKPWWLLLQFPDFAGHFLRRYCCFEYQSNLRCSSALEVTHECPRSHGFREWISTLRLILPADRPTNAEKRRLLVSRIGLWAQWALESNLFTPRDRACCVSQGLVQVEGGKVCLRHIECTGTASVPSGERAGSVLRFPRVLALIVDCPSVHLVETIDASGFTLKDENSGVEHRYEPVAFVFQQPSHFVTVGLYDELWLRHNLSQFEREEDFDLRRVPLADPGHVEELKVALYIQVESDTTRKNK